MSNKSTILFITHYSGMYGANKSLYGLMLELRMNFDIKPVVLLPARGEFCDFLEQNNITYYVSHFYWWVNEGKGVFQYLLNWRKQIRNLIKLKQLFQLIENENIDLVYSNSITINIGTFISRKLRCPHIWHIRESLESYKFKLSLGKFISKLFLKTAADKYILISDYLISAYVDLLPSIKTQRIYNGIDFSSTSLNLKREIGIINICMVGIISEQKNNFDALKALDILVNEWKYFDLRLHFIGDHKSEYFKKIKKFISESELHAYVVFHGHINNLDTILSKMDLGLMCSRDEGFGRVTVEYMMHSMPVIASNSGANKEIIKDGINGFIYNIYNEIELASKIQIFIRQPELLKEIGHKAFQFGKENFSSIQNTKAIYKIINELLSFPRTKFK